MNPDEIMPLSTDFELFPPQASTIAGDIDALYFFLWAVSAFFTVLIFTLITYFAIKYRRRHPDERPAPTIESLKVELTYTFIPLVLVMVMFFWGAKLYFRVYAEPAGAIDIHVIGKQWMWKIQHPDGVRELNELHVPLGQQVQLTLASQDVIHSFYIPAFRVKMDVIPGRYTKMSFTPSKVGTYHLFCAEYCGTQHSRMIGRVIVLEPDAYQAWLAGVAADEPPAVSGGMLFDRLGCVTCHGSVAPSLAGLYGKPVLLTTGETVVADETYLRRSILNSTAEVVAGYRPIMPSYLGQITEEQLIDLIAYIKALEDEAVKEPEPAPQTRPVPAPVP